MPFISSLQRKGCDASSSQEEPIKAVECFESLRISDIGMRFAIAIHGKPINFNNLTTIEETLDRDRAPLLMRNKSCVL
jgi:hypothetical protein